MSQRFLHRPVGKGRHVIVDTESMEAFCMPREYNLSDKYEVAALASLLNQIVEENKTLEEEIVKDITL